MSEQGKLTRGKLYHDRLAKGLSLPKQLKNNNPDLAMYEASLKKPVEKAKSPKPEPKVTK